MPGSVQVRHEQQWRATTPMRWATRGPAGRIGTDEDMAGAAIYRASRAGDHGNGARTTAVDGGLNYATVGTRARWLD